MTSTIPSEAKDAIYGRLLSAWSGLDPEPPLALDNEDLRTKNLKEWARGAVRHRLYQQHTLGSRGNRKFERLGALLVQVFAEGGSGGSAPADRMVRAVTNAFEGESIPGTSVHFGEVSVREIGASGAWFQVNVEAEFSYYEIR